MKNYQEINLLTFNPKCHYVPHTLTKEVDIKDNGLASVAINISKFLTT